MEQKITCQCRFCSQPLKHTFCNLGKTPFANSYVKLENINSYELFFPLHAYVCASCFLVQLEEFQTPRDIFSDYAYFSSYSTSWVDHAHKYVDQITERFSLSPSHFVVEIASNDGYLLQFFKEKKIPVLGIEPAANVAKEAEKKEIPSLAKFFGKETARQLKEEGKLADLLIGNNVLAHVPDINDFVGGMKILLKPEGLITMEFPHLLQLMQQTQFDTIYHEHFSYLSLLTVEKIFAEQGLRIFDVEALSTHGGSLRIYACHQKNEKLPTSQRVEAMKKQEQEFGLTQIATYLKFDEKVRKVKNDLLQTLISLKSQNKKIAAYGAPAKGNTLLNFCGIKTDYLDYTVDLSPHKQEHFLPGTRIPIYSPEKIKETKPDYLLILPWNLKQEIINQTQYIKEWDGKWIVPIPELSIIAN